MKKVLITLFTLVIASGLLLAQDTTMELPEEIGFRQIQGFEIGNVQGDLKGTVSDVIIGEDGSALYFVIELSEPQELSGQKYLAPVEVAMMTRQEELGTFDVSSEDLMVEDSDALPTFEEDMLAAGEDWDADAAAYWQDRLGEEIGSTDAKPILTSGLLEYTVVAGESEGEGTVEDIMFSPEQRKISSIMISGVENLGAGQQTVPIDALTFDMEASAITVDMEAIDLQE